MEIINNRYKIENIYKKEQSGTVYIAFDLFDSNKKILIKIFENNSKNKKIIDYLIKEYIYLSRIKHKNLQVVYDFNIIELINNKKTSKVNYYYTKEYFEFDDIKTITHSLNLDNIRNILIQLLELMDYLEFRGESYFYLNPDNIYLNKDYNDKITIKVKDFITIKEFEINNIYDEFNTHLVTDLKKSDDETKFSVSINSIGKIGEFLLKKYVSCTNIEKENDYEKYKNILFIINKMINTDFMADNISYRDIISDLNINITKQYWRKINKEREHINYHIRTIGRDKEFEIVDDLIKNINQGNSDIRVLNILGENGSGKTRFLEEIYYRLRMNNNLAFKTKLDKNNRLQLKSFIDIIKSILKFSDESLVNKYGCELVKIIPEIGYSKEIKPSPSLSEEKEKLRLYDRICRFIVEYTDGKPIYFLLDHFHNADIDTLDLINYFTNNFENIPVLFIVSSDNYKLEKNKDLFKLINSWTSMGILQAIHMSKFNLEETSLMIKNMLGMNRKPIEFSTRIFKDTKGNPRHIEESIKNLYSTGNLFIRGKGVWSTGDEFNEMYITSNIDEAIDNQLKLLDETLNHIIKIMSIFNTSVSKDIISEIIEIDESEVDILLENLISSNLIDKMVEDWGFTYDIKNIKVKKFIYYKMDGNEKIDLHKKVANILEKLYIKENRIYEDELIYHFTMSNQSDKAIDYCISSAKNMQKLSIYTQSISLWQKANRLLENKLSLKRVEVLYNLGELLNVQGKYNEALNYCNESLQLAKQLNSVTYAVLCKNSIANIYFEKKQIIQAENFARESKSLSEQIDYKDGILKSQIILNKINLSNGKNEKVLKESIKYLYIAEENHKDRYIGELLNQIGVVQMFMGQFEAAEKYFNRSINHFNQCSDHNGITKAMNNLAIIYSDLYGDFDKAIEYLQKGLDISIKHNNFQAQITFLNNIGEIYYENKHQYHKAKEYFEKIIEIGKDVGQDYVFSIVNINLGLITLKLGQYDECFRHYYKLIEKYKNNSIQWQELSGYYDFMMKFYINFGLYDKAIEVYKLIEKNHSKYDYKYYLSAECMKVITDFYKYNTIDKEKINYIREQFRDSTFIGDRKYYLLNLAYIAIDKNKKMSEDIILEYENISDGYNTEYLDVFYNFIKMCLNKLNIEEASLLYKSIKKLKIPELQIMTNKVLGDKEFETNNYYNSVNYYAISIDIIQRLTKNIPDSDIKNRMEDSNLYKKIILKLNDIKNIFNTDNEVAVTRDIDEDKSYYDFTVLDKYFLDSNLFDSVYRKFDYNELNGIKNIEDLILELTSNQVYNLELILKFAMRETFAERGYILYVLDEEENKILANSQNDDWHIHTNNVIKAVEKMKEGILVKSPIKNEFNPYDSFIKDDTKSLICIPIYKNTNNILNEDDRRHFSSINKDSILGYIYLDTDKLFNKFNEKSFKLIKIISNLASMNIENYYLKIVSSIDKLTGAYTRKYMDSVFDDILLKSKNIDEEFSIIMLDIDKFKNVNDTFGHQKGDEILRKLSNIVISSIRSSDIVSRYGGEEFIIILPNTNKTQSKEIAEKIRLEIANSKLMGDDYALTISLGISTFPHHAKVKDDLIEKADQALYHAKNSGRNKSILWDENIAKYSNRSDRLAGIMTGNTVEDQRKVLAMIDIIDLIKRDIIKADKIYLILGRIIEMIEAEYGSLVIFDRENIKNVYTRVRLKEEWVIDHKLNESIINSTLKNKKGEYIIDWETVKDKDVLTGNPNWQSIITTPLIYEGKIKGILYISVPIKEREFDYRCYNFISTIGDIVSSII